MRRPEHEGLTHRTPAHRAAAPTIVATERPFEVVAIEQATPRIRRLWLRPAAGALGFRPGQYVQLGDAASVLPPRSYSIANAPRPDGLLTLLVARFDHGSISGWVHESLAVGDQVLVSGPYGAFVDDPHATAPALFLAAGAGYAPIRALLEASLAVGRRRQLTLLFSARTEADVIDAAQLAEWQRRRRRFRFLRTLTREPGPPPLGRIPALLPSLALPLRDCDVFIAGMPDFVRACAATARALGADATRLRTELFALEPQPWYEAAPDAAQTR